MLNYYENYHEELFASHKPYWHLCTNGKEAPIIFSSDEEYALGLNILAAAACLVPEVTILTFVLMSNHIHLILFGPREKCIELFNLFKAKLSRNMRDKALNWNTFQASIKPIDDLDYLKTSIIYVNRNAYLADLNYNPFSYPWGAGREMFNFKSNITTTKFDDLTLSKKREYLHTRDFCENMCKLRFNGNLVEIDSFCRTDIAQSYFNNSRNYTIFLFKKVEMLTRIALEFKDEVVVTDNELSRIAFITAKEKYQIDKLYLLTAEQKIEVAIELKKKYNATKSQLRRLLNLTREMLEKIFPDFAEK